METLDHSFLSSEAEPVATEVERLEYEREFEEEKREEEMLKERFSKAVELRSWCSCGRCSLDRVINQEECFCCCDIERCREKCEEFEVQCVTDHPGFQSVCLDTWVLEAASVGLKTKSGRSYNVVRRNRQTSDDQFFRSVSYRQFYRLIWKTSGKPTRLPLPCCVYNAVREHFPSPNGVYQGFEDAEESEESDIDSRDRDSDFGVDNELES